MNTRSITRQRAESGFALPSAIFLLVILAALAAFLVRISMTQSMTSAQDIQGARAYHAARAGIDWGLYEVLDPTNATAVAPTAANWPNMRDCPAPTDLTLDAFTVRVVCERFPAGAATASGPPVYTEAGSVRSIIVYRLTATARLTGSAVGDATYIEREVSVVASKCRASDMPATPWACP